MLLLPRGIIGTWDNWRAHRGESLAEAARPEPIEPEPVEPEEGPVEQKRRPYDPPYGSGAEPQPAE